MLVYQLQICLLLLPAWILCQACDTGYFGKDCKYSCKCQNSTDCDIEGGCPNNGPCKTGFFGAGCQYVDVLQHTTSSGDDQFLRDGDDTTCNPKPRSTVIGVYLTTPIQLSWFRVVLKDTSNKYNFKTELNGKPLCVNERRFPVGKTMVDVNCDKKIELLSFRLKGKAVGSICSIFLSGGRNVARGQNAAQSSDYDAVKSTANKAVDGHYSTTYDTGHCASTTFEPQPPWWKLIFSEPKMLNIVLIYNRDIFQDRLVRFTVQTLDKDNNSTSFYNRSETTLKPLYIVDIPTRKPVSLLTIVMYTLLETSEQKVLTLCEVETYGELFCPEGKVGLDCDKVCHCNITETCHPYSGACVLACKIGTYGPDCSTPCPPHCLDNICEFISGKCLQCASGYLGEGCVTECDPGTFGFGCALKCSMNCADVCNITNGYCRCKVGFKGLLCTDCAPRFYGDRCHQNCSQLCTDRLCVPTTGHCLSCTGKRFGPFCRDCPWSYYGPLCEAKCDILCLNQTCDPVTGICRGCKQGYQGPRCEPIPESFPLWVLVIPLLLLLLILLLCLRKRSKAAAHVEGELVKDKVTEAERLARIAEMSKKDYAKQKPTPVQEDTSSEEKELASSV